MATIYTSFFSKTHPSTSEGKSLGSLFPATDNGVCLSNMYGNGHAVALLIFKSNMKILDSNFLKINVQKLVSLFAK